MNEEAENIVLDTSGDDISSVVDSAPLDMDPSAVILEPEPPSQFMEVISVDELLDRLTTGEVDTAETPEVDIGEEAVDGTETEESGLTVETIGESGPSNADTALELLEVIQKDVDHSFLSTDFADYTVTEGLLLMALLLFVISLCIKMLKEGFSWL